MPSNVATSTTALKTDDDTPTGARSVEIVEPQQSQHSMKYRPEIDGLRAVAVIPVILFHAGTDGFSGGYIGVDIFFVISGYLITSIILSECEQGTFSFTRFYERRIRRIFPALFFLIFSAIPIAWFTMLPHQLSDFSQGLMAISLFASNIFFWRESGYFEASMENNPLLHTWSLAVEEQFYIFFPLFLLSCWRFGRRFLVGSITVIFFLSLGIAEWGSRYEAIANFYLLPSRAWELSLGCFAAFALFYKFNWVESLQSVGAEVLSATGFVLILLGLFVISSETPFPSIYGLLPTGGTLLIILFAARTEGKESGASRVVTLVGSFLSTRVLIGIGLLSYSLYLWHHLIFAFARISGVANSGEAIMYPLMLLSFVFAYFSWRFIESPFRDKQQYSRRQIFSLGLLVSLLIFGIGLFGYHKQGFLDLYPESDQEIASLDQREQGSYVAHHFDEILLQPFSSASSKKVFLIGDSYAQDFLNLAVESRAFEQVSVSTHKIGRNCGLILSDRNFEQYIEAKWVDRCRSQGRFESPRVINLIQEADIVLLVASWQRWHVPFVPETVSGLYELGAKQVVVVGRKNFGKLEFRKYLGLTAEEKNRLTTTVLGEHQEINDQLSRLLKREAFVDLQRIFCSPDNTCPLFTNDGKLISFDGSHLTKAGAKYLGGIAFSSHPLLQEIATPEQ